MIDIDETGNEPAANDTIFNETTGKQQKVHI